MATKTYADPIGGGSFVIAYKSKGKRALVIGGGAVAAGRVFSALDSDMSVTLLSPKINDELQYRVDKGQIQWICDEFHEKYLEGVDIVLSTIDDTVVSREIVSLCRKLKIFVNAADINDLCDFWFMSMHRDGPVQIAVSTNSCAPRLASRIRKHIAQSLPEKLGDAVHNIGLLRQKIKLVDPEPSSSRKRMAWLTELCDYWPTKSLSRLNDEDIDTLLTSYIHQKNVKEIVLNNNNHNNINGSDLAIKNNADELSLNELKISSDTPLANPSTKIKENIKENQDNIANENLNATSKDDSANDKTSNQALDKINNSYTIDDNCISRGGVEPNKKGKIVLVGSGLGDPDLLTVQATRYLEQADLILADKLIPKQIFEIIKKGEIFIARKYPGMADSAQDELNRRGIEALNQGKTVVRLKQGDPFVFGRGGEEVLFYKQFGYDCIIVPGLSSALTAPGLNGIPVTHRGVADQVLILSGNNRFNELPNIPPYIRTRTLVFLMVIKKLEPVVGLLTSAGYPPNLDVAILSNAGCHNQRKITGTLETIVEINEKEQVELPALMVVGWSVTALQEKTE
ncbi:hypothetical protein BB560_003372 [Smittium megazygosporum]|uniref:precorrin-2 dehydrogenase n=1 Tax=Smittium megazygosporum TaxID=133381 RepID=A0A2T9ZCA0_9FUNG|nr:hypothetical protein BB560_003372 [Smittium megazygosporum]